MLRSCHLQGTLASGSWSCICTRVDGWSSTGTGRATFLERTFIWTPTPCYLPGKAGRGTRNLGEKAETISR